MGYILTKIVLSLILPPASLLLLMLLGLFLMGCCRGCGRVLIAIGIIGLYCFSITPVSDALLKPLESYAQPIGDRRIKAEAIVVLGGGTMELSWVGLPPGLPPEAEARVVEGFVLYRKLRRPIVFVGGTGNPVISVVADADAMALLARKLGVPEKDILVENRSRNTLEGARMLSRVSKAKRIILVTSAYHMKRAAGMFRKQGYDVVPAPTAYLSEQKQRNVFSFIPRAETLAASATACSEYTSLTWYSLAGHL